MSKPEKANEKDKNNGKMFTDERNFRSSYYEKVGYRGVEEKKSLEMLLGKDKTWDKVKLKQFCLLYSIHVAYRNIVWKVLLGVLPVHTESHEFVLSQRQMQYCDLLHALKVMKIINNGTPKPQQFLAMYLLDTGNLRHDFNLQMNHNFIPIVESVSTMYEKDVDVYWISKCFYQLIESLNIDVVKLTEHVKNLLQDEDKELYQHLIEIKAFDILPFNKWFKTCFAGVLYESALAKIWDKICGGAPKKLLAFVAVVLLITLRWNLLKSNDQEQILKCISLNSDQSESIANKTIEKWQNYGSIQHENLAKK